MSVGWKKAMFSMGILSEGEEVPNNTSTSSVIGGVDFAPSYRQTQQDTVIQQHGAPTFAPEGGGTIRSS